MTNKILRNRLSQFGSAPFLWMLANAIISMVVLANVHDSFMYPGLIIATVFYIGLVILTQSNYGSSAGLGPLLFFLPILPEFINIYVVEPSMLIGVLSATFGILFYYEKTINTLLKSIALFIGIGIFQLAKLDLIGSTTMETFGDFIQALVAVSAIIYVVVRYLRTADDAFVATETLLDLESYADYIRNAIGTAAKVRIQLQEQEGFTNEIMEPIELAFPFIKAYGRPSSAHRISLIQLYSASGAPVLECSNLQLELTPEIEQELRYVLAKEEYALFLLNNEGDHFSIAPEKLAHRWGQSPGKLKGMPAVAISLQEEAQEVPHEHIPEEVAEEERNGIKLGWNILAGMRTQKPKNGSAFDFAHISDEIENHNGSSLNGTSHNGTNHNGHHYDRIIGGPEDSEWTNGTPVEERPSSLRELHELQNEEAHSGEIQNAQPELTEEETKPETPTKEQVHQKFRENRSFDPQGGRSLTRLRKIPKDGGSKDFQWNVPSK